MINVLWVKSKGWSIDSKNHKIPSIDWENKKTFELFVEAYASKYSNEDWKLKHSMTKEKVRELFDRAMLLVNKWALLQELEEQNIECEQVIISWFRFHLIYKETKEKITWDDELLLRKERKKIVKKELDSMQWTVELIWSRINQDDDLSWNIQIYSYWKKDFILRNSSNQKLEKLINEKNKKRFTHRPVNLKDKDNFWYNSSSNEERLFKYDILDYINNSNSKEEIQFYLIRLIEFCNSILQRKDIWTWNNDLRYLLESKWINLEDTKAIWNLRKFLKYVLNITPLISEMMESA